MEKSTNLDRIEIILVDTQDGANIGSACRAMKTMGLSHLTLVTSATYDENRVRTLALHASDLWENRKEFRSLEEAISDSVLAVAATRRHGKYRKMSCVTPEELAQRVTVTPKGKISIVFGCESSGLTDEQVRLCSMVVTIPTSDAFPSLNLAQAVQIICYALFSNLKKYPSGGNIVNLERVNAAAAKCFDALEEIGYFKSDEERAYTLEFLKDQFARSAMTESEIKRFEKIFTKRTAVAKFKK
jgi:tRNA/rRNA methyltransferase